MPTAASSSKASATRGVCLGLCALWICVSVLSAAPTKEVKEADDEEGAEAAAVVVVETRGDTFGDAWRDGDWGDGDSFPEGAEGIRAEKEWMRSREEEIEGEMGREMENVSRRDEDRHGLRRSTGFTRCSEEIRGGASEEIRGGASEEIRGGASEEIRGGASEEIRGGASEEIRGVASEEIRGGASEEIRGGASEEIRGVATEEICGGASEEIRGGASEEICGVATEEIRAEETERLNWVTSFRVFFSNDTVGWFPYRTGDYDVYFPGNRDAETPVLTTFPVAVAARYLRINPQNWHHNGSVCLRMEVLGCLLEDPYDVRAIDLVSYDELDFTHHDYKGMRK
ncbi:unnamed protein product, partial [Lampetra planeri]